MTKPVTATPIMVRWQTNGEWEPAIWTYTSADSIYAVGMGFGTNISRTPWADCGPQWRPAFMEEISAAHEGIAVARRTKLAV